MTCETTRETIHAAFDDDRADELTNDVRAHLASCGACRDFAADLAKLTSALRELPREPFPADALDAVWRATIRAGAPSRSQRLGGWRAAAAAIVVTALGASTLYLVSTPSVPPGPSRAELARAEAQAEMVFGYTARALAATRKAATHQVIVGKVSPAVRGAAVPRSSRRAL